MLNVSRTGDPYLTCHCYGQYYDMAPLVFGCPSCARRQRISVLEVGYQWEEVPPTAWDKRRPLEDSRVSLDDPIVCVLTAAGIKWPEQMSTTARAPMQVDPTPEAVDRYLVACGLAE